MQYHVDRFYAALEVLAGDGSIKQRLIAAYRDNLDDLDEDEMPQPVQAAFASLRERLHRVTPLNGEAAVCATVRKMSSDEASRCAASLLSLYREMVAARDERQSGVVPLGGEAAEPFIVKSVG